MRKYIVLGSMIGILIIGYNIRRKPCSHPLVSPVSPATTVFAFDLHGVVLTPDYMHMAHVIWYKFPKREFIKFLAYPFGLHSLWRIVRSQESTEQAFNEFFERHPQLSMLKPVLVELIAAQWLNTENIKILHYLKSQGYTLVILSNIWHSAYTLLIQRYPVLGELFSGVYLPSSESNYAHKPERVFYEGFKRYLAQLGLEQQQIIFVENNHENIENACKAGLHALHVNSIDALIQKLRIS